MSIDRKILSEIERYKKINGYLSEQEEPVDPAVEPEADLAA